MADKRKWVRAREMALKNLRDIAPEEDARITADALADPDNPSVNDYAPGSYGCHEALHTASVVMDLVETSLIGHPAVAAKPEWKALAEKAHGALFDLYQAIGAEHL